MLNESHVTNSSEICLKRKLPPNTDLARAGLRRVGGLVGARGAHVRDAGRPAALRSRQRGRPVREHHERRRAVPGVAEQGGRERAGAGWLFVVEKNIKLIKYMHFTSLYLLVVV